MRPAAWLFAVAPLFLGWSLSASARETLNVWPGKPPGDTVELPAEADTSGPDGRKVADRAVIRLGNVSTPQITVFQPPADKNTGAAIIICPGGGHRILAYDLEGTEVAEWLATKGITGIVLKYRVPFRDPNKKALAGVQDAQRAISLTRQHSQKWGIDPQRIGLLGFSAGGEIAARTALAKQRLYEALDAADEQPCRPDFSVLIYPAYLTAAENRTLAADLEVDKTAPPTFLVHAHDDPVTPLSSVLLYAELKRAGVPAELHVFSTGGHGYGLRETPAPITGWPRLFEAWLQTSGFLKSPRTSAKSPE